MDQERHDEQDDKQLQVRSRRRRTAVDVVNAYANVLGVAGAPLTASQRAALLRPVSECLDVGHDPAVVLAGLGCWRAEGFGAAHQVPEFVTRVAMFGPLEPEMTPAALVAEGARRHHAYQSRRHPSAKQRRETRNNEELSAWVRDRKERRGA